MNPPTALEVLSAVQRLPAGAILDLPGFAWEHYERLLAFVADHPGLRIRYDRERLEVLSPSPAHDEYARLVDFCVFIYCEVRGLKLRAFGNATWKRQDIGRGLEADACYYTRNEEHIRGKSSMDLATDPPPDIAVEIDLSRSSIPKFSIYTALAIPEVWRFDGQALSFYVLSGSGEYIETPESRALPGLTALILCEVLQAAKAGDVMDALKAFRNRLTTQPT
jgi:Uma2 family endonuclease